MTTTDAAEQATPSQTDDLLGTNDSPAILPESLPVDVTEAYWQNVLLHSVFHAERTKPLRARHLRVV